MTTVQKLFYTTATALAIIILLPLAGIYVDFIWSAFTPGIAVTILSLGIGAVFGFCFFVYSLWSEGDQRKKR